jgi:hypothetical protein
MTKLNKPIKIKLKFNLNIILTVVALLFVVAELYYGYQHLYTNMLTEPNVLQTDKVVRVDIASYKSEVDMLSKLNSYYPDRAVTNNPNPFK